MKFLFLPVSIASGLLAGQLSKKLFDFIWERIDDEDAPRPKHREIRLPKLALALVIEGALFRLPRVSPTTARGRASPRLRAAGPAKKSPSPHRSREEND